MVKKTKVILMAMLFCTLNLTAYAQGITLKYNNITVKEAMVKTQENTGYSFVFESGDIDTKKIISLNVTNQSIDVLVKQIIIGQPLQYEIKEKNIIVRKKKEDKKPVLPNPGKKITGLVTDSEGEPIIGATIQPKGSTTGTITNYDGLFSLDTSEQAEITISYIGFKQTFLKVGSANYYKISLEVDSKNLDELVVIGYGTQRRSLVSSAISKVKIDENNLRNVASPSQLLDGRVAGVSVSTGSGNLGSGEKMSIRGSSSLSASNEPLYVIDGIPITNTDASLFNFGEKMSSLATLNLTDIESIEVLKDAASAAIYGSRATNGVILITTKSGKDGRSDIKLNVNTGFSQFANKNKLKLASSDLYISQYNEGIDNYNKQNGSNVGDPGYKIHISNPFQGSPDTDWLAYILQTGYFQNADLSFSGGNKLTKYYIGANISNQTGVVRTNAMQKINMKARVSHEITSWLEVGANTSGNYVKNSKVPGANLGSTIIARAIEQRPFDRPYKPNGSYYVGGTVELTRHNPVQILDEENAYLENFRYLGNFYTNLKFNKKLSWRNTFNSDIGYTYDYTYYNVNHPYGTGTGRIVEYNRLINNNLYESVLNYNDKFGNLSADAVAGHSFQKISSRTSMIDGSGFPSPSFDVVSVASLINAATGNISEYDMESYFGRTNLSYLEKYILTLTMRTDGSSKFAPATRWGWFPSASVGWNVSQEEFMKNSGVGMKFRLSYGKTGNQEGIGNYAYQSLMSGGKNYGLESGIATSSFGNDKLTWETADQYDVGFDMDLLKGKINIVFDAYLKNTNNLLYSMPIQATSGVTNIINNIGSMRNIGVEFTLNTHFKFDKVDWISQFNISTNKNSITSLIGDDKPMSIGANRALQIGKELGAFYLFKQDGIYQYDGQVPQAFYDLGVRAGDVRWDDVDKNNIINDNDRQIVGSSNPDFFGGWNNTLKYKGFQLDIFLTYMYGNDVYAQWKVNGLGRIGYQFATLENTINNRWTGPGTSNKYPRSINSGTNNDKNSDRWLEDGSFIRLRNLTLGYNFPTKIISGLHIKALRLFVQGDNLFLLTKYSGWDPEVNSDMDPRYSGVDLFNVPQPRTLSIGANISF